MYKTVQFILHTIPEFSYGFNSTITRHTVYRYKNIYHYFKGSANMGAQ